MREGRKQLWIIGVAAVAAAAMWLDRVYPFPVRVIRNGKGISGKMVVQDQSLKSLDAGENRVIGD